MDAADLLKPIAKIGGLIRLHGVGLVILGALAVWAPQMTGMTVSVIVGVVLIIGGILRTTFAWIATGWGSLFLRAAVGILTIIATWSRFGRTLNLSCFLWIGSPSRLQCSFCSDLIVNSDSCR